jgi:hypothetical protein
MGNPEQYELNLNEILKSRWPAAFLRRLLDPQTSNATFRGLCKSSRNQTLAIKYVRHRVELDANMFVAS